ncbi:alpha/beta fold hydrolase [Kribbella sp. NPDC003557]|uniref:alpha/beta fold hydrolase n=1 Tax=Kribbella sp. NPDC003557 TaxID=3154449 RepID=UPI0033A1B986
MRRSLTAAITRASIAGAVLAAAVPVSAAAAAEPLDWKACKPGAVEQCAMLTVPLDWSKPSGPTTNVFVAKVPAKDQKHKLGALFFNPGGPGGAGGSIFAAGLADAVLAQYRDRYDLVSFDPRGTGSSSQLDCGPVLRRGVPVFPKSKAQYDALVASSRATGEQCLKQHGDLMRNLDTRTVARDMDAIRAALGESKFNYLGLSYGSYLGTLYAQQFPQRVGRMVLDGIVDHKQGALKFMLDEAKAMEDGFNRFAKWCTKDTSCALHGQDGGAVWDATVRKADKTPLSGPHGPVNGDVLRMALPTLLPLTSMVSDNWRRSPPRWPRRSRVTAPTSRTSATSAIPRPRTPRWRAWTSRVSCAGTPMRAPGSRSRRRWRRGSARRSRAGRSRRPAPAGRSRRATRGQPRRCTVRRPS